MAKQVEDIVVRLVGEGFEALDKIKGSFRELGKVTNLAEKDILSARDSLLDYARKAGNTEAVNKGLIDAFKGLRSQVDLSSDAYRSLSAELRRLDEESKGATRSVMAQRDAVLSSTAAGTQNVAALQQQRAALIALRTQTRESSTAFNQFSTDIQAVEARLTNLADVNNRLNSALSRARAGTAAGARAELEVIERGISLRREEINDIDLLNKKQRNTPEILRQRLELENQLNASLAARRQIQFQETARTGRENVRTGAATFNSADLTGTGYLTAGRIAGRLGDLPDTTAGLSQELGELNERLINTYRNTDAYLQVAMQMAGVQRELTAVTRGYAQSLLMGIRTGAVSPSMRNLQEAATALRAEMAQLDTTTTEGSRAYADNAREANTLERRLRTLADAYREVGSMATVAATAEQNAANAPIRNNYLNRGAVRQQEQALRQLGEQVRQGIAGTPLLLPAAGQTSAPGTGQVISGGANVTPGTRASRTVRDSKTVRMLGYGPDQAAGVERFFSSTEPGRFASSRPIGPTATPGQAAQNRSEQIAQRDALKATADAARATEQQMQRLRAAVDIATKANTGSVTSLGRLREALVNLRNEIPGTNKEFQQLNQQVEGVDRRSSRLQTSRRPSTGQLVQAGGAAISGGIFGGPEGFLGGVGGAVLGTALPGIGTAGGAFAGAAAGAQVGMFRQQLAGTADYAASIGKLQIALRGVVGSQAAYDAAIRAAAAATRDLNIPQEEATRGLTRLSAAVIGAGGTVGDSSFAFRAMSEAIKATGGNAEQVDGALLALTQVFSKGKVSAEELNQIAERLPGTFTLFAQAAGKTGPELQKALEQGQVGLNDLMKFLDLTSKRYGTTALEIAGSSQDAGARLTVAFQAMRLEVGKALQPLGAELQGAFAAFISEITPAVVGSAKALAAAITFFTTNETVGGLAKFAFQVGAVALAIKALGLLLGPVSQGLALMGVAFGKTSAQAVVAQGRLAAFGATVKTLAKAVSGPILITIALVGAELVINYFKRIKAARDGLVKTTSQATGGQWLQEIGGNALGQEALTRAINDVGKAYAIASDKANQLRRERDRLNKVAGGPGGAATIAASVQLDRVAAELKAAEAEVKLLESRYKAGITRLPNAPTPVAATTGTNFPDPTGGEDASTKAADKARQDAEAAAADQQRLNEALAKAAIAFDDEVFRNRMELIRKEYEYKQELDNKARDLFIKSQTGAARETAGLISGFLGELQTLTNRLTEAGQGVETATQELKSAKLTAATTVDSAPLAAGIGSTALPGSISGRLDASGQNGADMPVGVNNAIKSYHDGVVKSLGTAGRNGNYIVVNFVDDLGNLLEATYSHVAAMVKVGDRVVGGQTIGRFDASGRTTGPHNSIDINSPGNNGSFQRNRETAAARRSADRLVRGRVQGAAGRQPTGAAAAARRGIAADGGVSTAEANLDKAKTLQALAAKQVKDLTAVAGQAFVLDFTDALRQQNAALSDGASITELRNRLQLAGERPETIDAEIRKAEAIQRSTQQTDLAAKALKALDDAGLGGSVAATSLRDGIAAQNAEIAKFKELTDAATASQIAFNEAMRMRQDDRIGLGMREGAKAYVESVGTMREATAQLTQTGIKGVEDALFSLVTTGTANFREFAAEILKQSARMILQLTIQRVLMQIIGAIGGGSTNLGDSAANVAQYAPLTNAMGNAYAANNIVPYAMGGAFTNSVVSKPTLFKFANGGTTRTGLMGEAGPEAIMPLKRGADGRLGVSGGGSAPVNVTVNVDASGGSKVAGDPGQGAQLGRLVAGAVQAELVRQKRPGGLLA